MQILRVAERFGKLPDEVENNMSEFWFQRALILMYGESEKDKIK